MTDMFDLEALREQRANERAEAHTPDPTIAACTLCDENGYRPNFTVCDHIDHAPAYRAGMALVREALQKGTQR
ncbi:MAG: hypothetical protein E6R06_31050 [Mycobacterium sp.]|nr:MAG: hypothetical protein E6R06_31050 [Mycobacterium sp.]